MRRGLTSPLLLRMGGFIIVAPAPPLLPEQVLIFRQKSHQQAAPDISP